VLAELTKMGLENIGYELVTDVLTFRSKNGPRKVHEVTGDDGMAYKAIRALVQEGAIKKLSLGHYQRAGVKALPAPKPSAPKGRGGAVRRHEIGNKEVILTRIKGRRRFTLKELRDHFANIRRNPKSISPIISALSHVKLITKLEGGVYAWGKKKIAKKKEVRKKRDASVASPEQTNG